MAVASVDGQAALSPDSRLLCFQVAALTEFYTASVSAT